VPLASARAELHALASQIAQESPQGNVYPDGGHFGIGVNALQAETIGGSRLPIVLFMGASLLLLLIAGLNAANLVLVRGLSRSNEVSVRRALGAVRGRLVRMFVAEAFTLAVIGGVVGVMLAYAGIGAFRQLGPSGIPRLNEIAVDGRIAALACLVTLMCGVLMGLIPALRLTSDRQQGPLGGTGFRSTGANSVWSWTVSAQVALSMMLMASAGLLMGSFIKLRSFSPGFNPDSALVFRQGLKRPGAEQLTSTALWEEMLDQVRSVPGYTAVAAGSNLPFQSPNWAPSVLLPGEGPETMRSGVAGYVVSPNYFSTLGILMQRGRGLESGDGAGSRSVALVNEAFVRTHMGDRDPLGMTLRLREDSAVREVDIVGVVSNAVQSQPEEGFLPAVYVPYTQWDWPEAWFFARSDGDPSLGVAAVRRTIGEVNAYIPPQQISTMSDRIGATRTGPRFNAALAMAFGLVSLLLAAGGLFGTLSFGVRSRAKEIGVRMAMGASRNSVLGLIMGQGLRVAAVGVTLGLTAALFSGRLIQRFLFDVGPSSVPTLALVTACLLVVAIIASLGPALAASRVDPMTSLGAD
jgi:predicted permease